MIVIVNTIPNHSDFHKQLMEKGSIMHFDTYLGQLHVAVLLLHSKIALCDPPKKNNQNT